MLLDLSPGKRHTFAGEVDESASNPSIILNPDADGSRCKDAKMAGRTKGVRPTCPELLKGRGEARYFAHKGTQGKGGVRRKSKAKGLSAGDSPGSDRSARPEVRGAQDEGNESGIQ